MTADSRSPKAGLKLLFDFWGKYHAIDSFHYQWAKDNLKVKIVKRGEQLNPADRHSEMTYFVAKGLLARVEENAETGKRRIMSLAIPNMALMTTNHLYTHNLHSGHIVALRSGIIIAIPHHALRQFQEQEKSIDTLIDVLGNKRKGSWFCLGRPPWATHLLTATSTLPGCCLKSRLSLHSKSRPIYWAYRAIPYSWLIIFCLLENTLKNSTYRTGTYQTPLACNFVLEAAMRAGSDKHFIN